MEVNSVGDLRVSINESIKGQKTSVYALAQKSGVSQAPLGRFLNGKGGANMDTVFSIAPALRKRILWVDLDEVDSQPSHTKKKDKEDVMRDFVEAIEDYKANTDPNKPKFSVDFIVGLLDKAFEK